VRYCLGIDVGTSYTAGGIARPGGVVEVAGLGPIADNFPTVLYFGDDGSTIVGDAANRRSVTDPSGSVREFKRRLGDPTPIIVRTSPYSPESLVAKVLGYVSQRVTERERGEPAKIAVTYPANWGPYKQELFGQALRLANLEDCLTLSEPHAAALAYAAQTRVPSGSMVAVYDLGGGTFDAAVLRKHGSGFELVGEATGIEHLGGADFDDAMFRFVLDRLAGKIPDDAAEDPLVAGSLLQLRRSCVEAKELLSTEMEARIPVMLPGSHTTVPLTRADFETMIRPRIDDSFVALDQALAGAGVRAVDLSALLLVGGSSRIPLIARLLRERYGQVVAADIDPLYAVARGAAIAAAEAAQLPDARRSEAAPAAAPPSAPLSAQPMPVPTPAPVVPPTPAAPFASPAAGPSPALPANPMPAPVPQPVAAAGAAAPLSAQAVPLAPAPPARAESDWPPPSGKGRSKLPMLIGGGVVAALLVGGGVFALQNGGGDDAQGPSTTRAGTESTLVGPGSTGAGGTTATASGQGMVAIPAGTYTLGLDKPDIAESPLRQAEVAAFHIDATEVTNAQFNQFVSDTGAPAPAGFPSNRMPAGEEQRPVLGVTFDWAQAYCEALGKRLPTETEWEVAARGPEAFLWPWGNDAAAVVLPDKGTYDVGTIPQNVSPFGVFDLTGNAWEWVSDPYDKRVKADERVLRGGNNGYVRRNVNRLPVDPLKSNVTKLAGFRCAASEVDPTAPPMVFGAFTEPGTPAVPELVPLPEGTLIDDPFDDPSTGWVEVANPELRFGYHPNEYFHLETRQPNRRVVAVAPPEFGPQERIEVSTSAFVEAPLTEPGGSFWYGLALRASADGSQFITFTVNPRRNSWQVATHTGPEPPVLVAEGPFTVPDNVTLTVRIDGNKFTFLIGATAFTERTIDFQPGAKFGLFLSSDAENPKSHIHFDRFTVRRLP
jgi:formylglycine-generating enzyme required for sulfatase activity/actin-like ATPase involved in cell morphogenesis